MTKKERNDAIIADLQAAIDDNRVRDEDKEELKALLATLIDEQEEL